MLKKMTSRRVGLNRRQRGFTLLELMISIVIASLLSLAVYMVYIATKKSSVTQEGVSEIRDVGFVLLERFDYALKHAGFVNYDESSDAIFTTNNTNFSSLDSALNKYHLNGNDELAINLRIPRFNNGTEMLACGGGQFPPSPNYNLTYQLLFKVDANQQLTCQIFQNGAPLAGSGISVLADNILRFKVFYQPRKDPTQNASTASTASNNQCKGTWQRANAITEWEDVCSVYIGLVVTGSTPMAQAASSTAQSFELAPNPSLKIANDTTVTVPTTNNTRPVARMLHKIVYLRN